ncbi:MAG: hypothetical protein WA975_03945, partial [Mesorhizobium sp.]
PGITAAPPLDAELLTADRAIFVGPRPDKTPLVLHRSGMDSRHSALMLHTRAEVGNDGFRFRLRQWPALEPALKIGGNINASSFPASK